MDRRRGLRGRFGREVETLAGNGHSGIPAPTNVAVVGLGYWGPNLLRVLFELPDVRVKYACDLEPEQLAAGAP